MMTLEYRGWVRDSKGKVISRPVKTISNTITQFVGGVLSHTTMMV